MMNETHPANSIEAAAYFHSLGIDTLPLPAGTKRIGIRGWQHADPAALWAESMEPGNVAIRCGGARNLTVVDCDDKNHPGTTETVLAYLSSLGLSEGAYPRVLTPSGGSHMYLMLDRPADGSVKKLASVIGAGELRYGCGAYVVAPPSEVQGNRYRLLSGDFSSIPEVDWPALAGLLPENLQPQGIPQPRHLLAFQAHAAGIPKRVASMLGGQFRSQYPSGSELDQAILTVWLNKNPQVPFEEVLREFIQRARIGRFIDLFQSSPETAENYLRRSYEKAVQFTAYDSAGKQEIQRLIRQVEQERWPGIKGLRLKAVFLSHLAIGFAAGRGEYTASIRQLSLISGQTTDQVVRANRTLIGQEKLVLVRRGEAIHPNTYMIPVTPSTIPPLWVNVPDLESNLNYIDLLQNDLFAPCGLGLTGAEVYWRLCRGRLTQQDLLEQTGLSPSTLRRLFAKLSGLEAPHKGTGELMPLIFTDGAAWGVNHGLDLSFALSGLQRQKDEKATADGRCSINLLDRRQRMGDRYARQRVEFRRGAARKRKINGGSYERRS